MPKNHLNDLSVPFKKSEYHHLFLHVHGLHISKTFYESGVEFLFSYIGFLNFTARAQRFRETLLPVLDLFGFVFGF